MSLSGAGRRQKGATAEREVVTLLKTAGWKNATRTSDGRHQHARGDIAHGPQGVHIEIKRHERLNVPQAFTQLTQDAKELDLPVLVHRPSRHEWMATLPLEELLALLALRERA